MSKSTYDSSSTVANAGGIVKYVDSKTGFADGPYFGVAEKATLDITSANRLAFLPADQIIIERSTDAGTTWVDAGISDSTKTGLFSAEGSYNVPIGSLDGKNSCNCMVRITITGMKYDVPEGTAETEKYQY